MNAREARSAARAELAKAALDGLPEAPKPRRKSAGAMTFKDYAPKFWEDYSRHWKPSTRKGNYGTIFGHLVEIFGHIRVDAIRKTDILQWRDSWADRTGTFNRSIPIMSGMMMYSEQLGLRPRGSNPCKGTPRFKCKLLERYLSAREFHRLAMALREFEVTGPIAVQAIQLLICTGARRRDRRVALGVGSTATAHAARQQDRSKDRLSQPAGSGGARYDSAAGTNRLRIPVAPRGQARRSRNPLEQHVSQPVFARYLNVSKNLVSDWERGKKRPGGPALRLLSIIQRKGLEAVALSEEAWQHNGHQPHFYR